MVHFQVEWNEDVQEQIIPNFDGSELHPEDTMLWSKKYVEMRFFAHSITFFQK
jgi:hypothetical protein